MATKKKKPATKKISKRVIDTDAQKRSEMAKRASLPIWYAYVAKDSNGTFFEGATDDLVSLRSKAASSKPPLYIVWTSARPTTYFAVAGYLNIVQKMSQETKAGYEGSAEDFLKTLSKIKLPLKRA